MKFEIEGIPTDQLNDVMEMYMDWVLKNELFGELDSCFDPQEVFEKNKKMTSK